MMNFINNMFFFRNKLFNYFVSSRDILFYFSTIAAVIYFIFSFICNIDFFEYYFYHKTTLFVYFILYSTFFGGIFIFIFGYFNFFSRRSLINISIYFYMVYNLIFFYFFDSNMFLYQGSKIFFVLNFYNNTISYYVDGINIIFVLLTNIIIFFCLYEVSKKVSNMAITFSFYFILHCSLVNAFFIDNIFFFYIFFEFILFSMFFIIVYGGSRSLKIKASYFIFIFTYFGSIFLLGSILWIQRYSGYSTFDFLGFVFYNKDFSNYLWFIFFFGFAVKIPLIPFHLWLPYAHVEASTEGSVVLAGILLKLGGYALIKFNFVSFPFESIEFSGIVYSISIISMFYSTFSCMFQADLKRIIAYSSVAHMSVVVLGIFSFYKEGLIGSLFMMVSHGFVSSALFLLIGFVYDQYRTRNLKYFSGLSNIIPVWSFFFLFFSLANMGVPGTSSFASEFLMFVGMFSFNFFTSSIMLLSVIIGTIYMLWMFSRVLYISVNWFLVDKNVYDLSFEDLISHIFIFFIVLFIGVYPSFFYFIFDIDVRYYFSFIYDFSYDNDYKYFYKLFFNNEYFIIFRDFYYIGNSNYPWHEIGRDIFVPDYFHVQAFKDISYQKFNLMFYDILENSFKPGIKYRISNFDKEIQEKVDYVNYYLSSIKDFKFTGFRKATSQSLVSFDNLCHNAIKASSSENPLEFWTWFWFNLPFDFFQFIKSYFDDLYDKYFSYFLNNTDPLVSFKIKNIIKKVYDDSGIDKIASVAQYKPLVYENFDEEYRLDMDYIYYPNLSGIQEFSKKEDFDMFFKWLNSTMEGFQYKKMTDIKNEVPSINVEYVEPEDEDDPEYFTDFDSELSGGVSDFIPDFQSKYKYIDILNSFFDESVTRRSKIFYYINKSIADCNSKIFNFIKTYPKLENDYNYFHIFSKGASTSFYKKPFDYFWKNSFYELESSIDSSFVEKFINNHFNFSVKFSKYYDIAMFDPKNIKIPVYSKVFVNYLSEISEEDLEMEYEEFAPLLEEYMEVFDLSDSFFEYVYISPRHGISSVQEDGIGFFDYSVSKKYNQLKSIEDFRNRQMAYSIENFFVKKNLPSFYEQYYKKYKNACFNLPKGFDSSINFSLLGYKNSMVASFIHFIDCYGYYFKNIVAPTPYPDTMNNFRKLREFSEIIGFLNSLMEEYFNNMVNVFSKDPARIIEFFDYYGNKDKGSFIFDTPSYIVNKGIRDFFYFVDNYDFENRDMRGMLKNYIINNWATKIMHSSIIQEHLYYYVKYKIKENNYYFFDYTPENIHDIFDISSCWVGPYFLTYAFEDLSPTGFINSFIRKSFDFFGIHCKTSYFNFGLYKFSKSTYNDNFFFEFFDEEDDYFSQIEDEMFDNDSEYNYSYVYEDSVVVHKISKLINEIDNNVKYYGLLDKQTVNFLKDFLFDSIGHDHKFFENIQKELSVYFSKKYYISCSDSYQSYACFVDYIIQNNFYTYHWIINYMYNQSSNFFGFFGNSAMLRFTPITIPFFFDSYIISKKDMVNVYTDFLFYEKVCSSLIFDARNEMKSRSVLMSHVEEASVSFDSFYDKYKDVYREMFSEGLEDHKNNYNFFNKLLSHFSAIYNINKFFNYVFSQYVSYDSMVDRAFIDKKNCYDHFIYSQIFSESFSNIINSEYKLFGKFFYRNNYNFFLLDSIIGDFRIFNSPVSDKIFSDIRYMNYNKVLSDNMSLSHVFRLLLWI
uniref:NADH-ubiquinone oxidoreductase chain 4 n=1 Tax=Acavomonas peruviana TaxID=1542312 RepID=V5KVG8_9ALVE|nr:NADH dehydrogenase subunit 4 [Acavomonas peruviana]AHA41677.1 NADH dehydrogenase subunit 4 [Acavomonas peruviana]